MNRQQADKLEQLKLNLIKANSDAFCSESYGDTEQDRLHNNELMQAIRNAERELIDYQASVL